MSNVRVMASFSFFQAIFDHQFFFPLFFLQIHVIFDRYTSVVHLNRFEIRALFNGLTIVVCFLASISIDRLIVFYFLIIVRCVVHMRARVKNII